MSSHPKNTPSRRALLASAPTVAAAGLAVGSVANIVAIAESKAAEVDPIFAVIAKHQAALEAWHDAFAWEDEEPYSKDADAAIVAGMYRSDAATHALLTVSVQPTTLAGVAALLEHVGQDECLDLSSIGKSEDTVLTAWTGINISNAERREIAKAFPLRLAAAVRSIIEGAQS